MDKYSYSYENDSSYCYPNTSVLRNKLNVTARSALYQAEREIVAYKTSALLNSPIKGNFDFEHLKAIHKYLFENIYAWAGNPRTVNIAKIDLFCLAQHIENYAEEVFGRLYRDRFYASSVYSKKIEGLVGLFADINALHPFREGNGRTQREYIEELAKVIGVGLDLTTVDRQEMILASHDSVNGDYARLFDMFEKCSKKLTTEETLEHINLYIQNTQLKNFLIGKI